MLKIERMNKLQNIFLIVLSVVLLFGCQSAAKEDDKMLNVGVMASMDYLPLAVAQREGYFKSVGVDVKLHKFYSANERDAAFQSKAVDGCVIDYTGAILQKSGGVDLRLVSRCDAPFFIVANKNSQIVSLADLKGKKIAVSQNTVIDFVVDMALKSVELTVKDIEKAEVNKIPLRFELLKNGKIDATGLPNPFALMLEKEEHPILTSNNELGFDITGIMFHSNVIDNNLEDVKKLYQAYNMGVDYLKTHSLAEIKDILVKELAFPEEIADQVSLPNYTYAQTPKIEDLEMTTKWLCDRGLVDRDFDVSSLLDSSVLVTSDKQE